MTGRPWPSALAAALFAIHPLRVESVAWVTERKDVLSGLFFVLTLAGVRRLRAPPVAVGPIWLPAMIAFFALGLMSKPMLVTLPCVLLLLDYWPLKRLEPPWRVSVVVLRVVEKLPLLALVGRLSLLTVQAQKRGSA